MTRVFGNEFPSFSAERAKIVLQQCADLTIELSQDMDVVSVMGSREVDPTVSNGWIGKSLLELVAPDSRPKLDLLLADNSAYTNGEARWRHLNLQVDGQPNLPLLLKFFRFVNEGTAFQMICARDLRPMVSVQRRFQQEQLNNRTWPGPASSKSSRSVRTCAEIFEIVKSAELVPIDQAVSSALANIERCCVMEALNQMDGDETRAATLLNISVEELKRRIARF